MLYVSLCIGLVLIVITTRLTQAIKFSSTWGLFGQVSAAIIMILVGELEISNINQFELGYLSIPFSLLFLVGFTNVMNREQEQTPLVLLLPFVTLVCISIFSFNMGYSFVSNTGICASLAILFVLLYGMFSGKLLIGRAMVTSISFLVAVLSLALFKISIVTIYIPIFTLALPLAVFYVIQNRFSIARSITISSLLATLFSVLMFIVPFNIIWYLIVGLTIILVISQLSSRLRFI